MILPDRSIRARVGRLYQTLCPRLSVETWFWPSCPDQTWDQSFCKPQDSVGPFLQNRSSCCFPCKQKFRLLFWSSERFGKIRKDIYFLTHPLYLMDGHSSKDEQTVASCSAISSMWFGFHCPKNDFMDKLWSSVKAWKDMFLVFHALRKNMMYLCTMSHVSWHFYLTIN